MTMYCHAALPLGDTKTFTRIGAMTSTIAMSYASNMNPRNWEDMAIFVCFDNCCSAIRTPVKRQSEFTSYTKAIVVFGGPGLKHVRHAFGLFRSWRSHLELIMVTQ